MGTFSFGNMAVSAEQAKGSKPSSRTSLIEELTARRISRIGRITLIALIRIKSLASESLTHWLMAVRVVPGAEMNASVAKMNASVA